MLLSEYQITLKINLMLTVALDSSAYTSFPHQQPEKKYTFV